MTNATAAAEAPTTLKRVLGTPSLVLFGLTYMLPLTVFTTYGIVTQLTGGRVASAYVITLIAMVFTARSYARMVQAYPYAGSAYVYTQCSFGGGPGFLTGWALLLDYLFLPMLCYLVIGIYLGAAFPGVPEWVFIVGSLVLITTLNLLGVVSVARANVVLITVQFAFIVVFVALTIAARAG
ncbi:MAG: APC family permease, partial [Leucobacter sp.]